MENYNRLFLLQDPAEGDHDDAVAALKDQILIGDDITDPQAKTGKVSLSQLNTYSGEVDIAALTNFKAVKIDSVTGNIYETNLAKLLIELQEVGGLEDAREEGLIDVNSILRDSDIIAKDEDQTATLHRAADSMQFIVDDLVDMEYTIPSGSEVGVPYPYDAGYFVPKSFRLTLEEPNGTRVKFVASHEDDNGDAVLGFGKDRIIVTLNGVVQDKEDGTFLYSDIGNGIDAYYGFEFNNAPVVGDEVTFMFDDAFNGAINSAGETEATTIAYSGAVASNYAAIEASIQTDREGWQNQLDAISYSAETEEKKQGQKMIKSAVADIESANTEGDIANALTGATAGFEMVKASHDKIVQFKSQEQLNQFKIDSSGGKLGKNAEAIKLLNERLSTEAAQAHSLFNALNSAMSDADAAKNDDGTGGQA
jgi:hypothetical protein